MMLTKEKNRNQRKVWVLIAMALFISFFALIFTGCDAATEIDYRYHSPGQLDDGIEVGTLAEADIDPDFIGVAVDKIREGDYKEVHSMLIFKENALVFEEYFPGHRYKWDGPGNYGIWVNWNKYMPHNIMSDTKSITSASIGLAIEHGYIESVHQSIFDYLPDYQRFNTDGKEQITIEHLLTMTSGFQWKEWGTSYTDGANDTFKLWVECDDQVACILNKPLAAEPGTRFNYSGGDMVLLAEIIKYATNMNIEEFSGQYLFTPLGIDVPVWEKYTSGMIDGSGGLKITPRDMGKIGLTFLNDGVWNGEQVISSEWVEKSAANYPGNERIKVPGSDSGRNGYGYTWWTKEYSLSGQEVNMFYAGGWGGQYIMVFPELDTVVVFTAGNYTSKTTAFRILEKFILPAIE